MLSRLLMAYVLFASFAGEVLAQDASCIFDANKAAIVHIEYRYLASDGDGDDVSKGSGFIISPAGHVITADHVVRPKIDNVKVKSETLSVRVGSRLSPPMGARVLEHVPSDDFALLQVDPRPDGAAWPTVKVADTSFLAVGAQLTGLGFGASGDLSIAPGLKSANNTIVDNKLKPYWQTNLPLNPGNSGGPIFGRLGTVVGVAVQKHETAALVTYVNPIARAQFLLDRASVTPAHTTTCAISAVPAQEVRPERIEIPASSFVRGKDVALGGPDDIYGKTVLLNAPPFNDRPNSADFEFNADGGNYLLKVEYAAQESREVDIFINGQLAISRALAAPTGCWFEKCQQLLNQGHVTLRNGSNILRIERPSVFPHIRKIVLEPVA